MENKLYEEPKGVVEIPKGSDAPSTLLKEKMKRIRKPKIEVKVKPKSEIKAKISMDTMDVCLISKICSAICSIVAESANDVVKQLRPPRQHRKKE